jgi:hypothetical protein
MFDLNFHNSVINFKNNGEETTKLKSEFLKGCKFTRKDRNELREKYETSKLAQKMIIGNNLLIYISDWCDYFDINFEDLIK